MVLSGKLAKNRHDDQTVGLEQGNDEGKGDAIEDEDPQVLQPNLGEKDCISTKSRAYGGTPGALG